MAVRGVWVVETVLQHLHLAVETLGCLPFWVTERKRHRWRLHLDVDAFGASWPVVGAFGGDPRIPAYSTLPEARI